MVRKWTTEGGDLGGAEEERAMNHAFVWHRHEDGVFGKGHLLVFVMDACDSWWVSRGQKLPMPFG